MMHIGITMFREEDSTSNFLYLRTKRIDKFHLLETLHSVLDIVVLLKLDVLNLLRSGVQLRHGSEQNWISSISADGGTYGVGETEICTSPELMYPGVIKEGAGPELICTGAVT
ncbi:hypothetical protein Tco_0493266 [Tanacetum coccineum]